jgi:hypothetical protein
MRDYLKGLPLFEASRLEISEVPPRLAADIV